ncbi:MAG: CinA family protein [Clostridiales bacterium]|nr:CinA family protein [Clostridiales bacterium]
MNDLYGLAETVVKEAARRGITLATAESLTAGLISATVADVPGASQILLGGVIGYALDVKRGVLQVEGIDEGNVVSADCARQMAAGARRLTGAKLAVSATGVAGPDGGTEQIPVGTVFIGCAYGDRIWAEEHHFTGDRQAVRLMTVRRALTMIGNCMKGGQ